MYLGCHILESREGCQESNVKMTCLMKVTQGLETGHSDPLLPNQSADIKSHHIKTLHTHILRGIRNFWINTLTHSKRFLWKEHYFEPNYNFSNVSDAFVSSSVGDTLITWQCQWKEMWTFLSQLIPVTILIQMVSIKSVRLQWLLENAGTFKGARK